MKINKNDKETAIFWLAHETKVPAVNIAGYSKLLVVGKYGKPNKKQR
jgi:hypothetical protein